MSRPNRINNVAIVGASGNSGIFMTRALLATKKHNVTALVRAGSQAQVPDGVTIKKIDYEKPETLVEALRGQDALVITLAAEAPKDTQMKLAIAAGEAGVPWILPNEWGPDTANEGLNKDIFIFKPKEDFRNEIEKLGKSSYIALSTGFWYEYSLAIEPTFGIGIEERRVTLFDEGETKISVSTWPGVGNAVAELLSLPIKPEGGNEEACLESLKNKVSYVQSFTISQKDMLASLLRVTGTKESDWSITKEPVRDRYATGLQEMKAGNRVGFAKVLYARVFYPDGSGDTEHGKGSINKMLNLQHQDIDEATKVAVERSKLPKWQEG